MGSSSWEGSPMRSCRLVVCACLLSIASSAAAHGRFPEAQQLVEHPSDPEMLGLSTTFGFVVSRDGGESWRWICRLATGAGATEDPVFAIAADGSLLGGVFGGLVRSPDGCLWDRPEPALTGRVVYDVVRHPTQPQTFFALTSDGGQANALFRSDDDGIHWSPTSEPIAPILFERVRIAPSDPRIIYLSGAYPRTASSPRRPFVHRSRDGGSTWEALPFDFRSEDERNLRLLAVDPARPEVLFMRVVKDPGAGPERLVRSEDAGATWETVLELAELTDLLVGPDGVVWVGGKNRAAVGEGDAGAPASSPHGLWRSDDGGNTFREVRGDLSVGCLAWRAGALWACADNYRDGFALGRSMDEGATFEPVLRFEELAGPVECPPTSDTAVQCAMTPGDADIYADLHVEPSSATSSSGCGCRGAGDGPAAFTTLLPLLALWRRERRHGGV